MLEGPLREQLMSPASVLLPEKLWPPVPPKAKVWVRTEDEYLEVTAEGVPKMGLFTFLRSRDVLQAHGQPVLNGLMGGRGGKKDSVLPNGPTDLAQDHQRRTSQRVPGTLERRQRQTPLLC